MCVKCRFINKKKSKNHGFNGKKMKANCFEKQKMKTKKLYFLCFFLLLSFYNKTKQSKTSFCILVNIKLSNQIFITIN